MKTYRLNDHSEAGWFWRIPQRVFNVAATAIIAVPIVLKLVDPNRVWLMAIAILGGNFVVSMARGKKMRRQKYGVTLADDHIEALIPPFKAKTMNFVDIKEVMELKNGDIFIVGASKTRSILIDNNTADKEDLIARLRAAVPVTTVWRLL